MFTRRHCLGWGFINCCLRQLFKCERLIIWHDTHARIHTACEADERQLCVEERGWPNQKKLTWKELEELECSKTGPSIHKSYLNVLCQGSKNSFTYFSCLYWKYVGNVQ